MSRIDHLDPDLLVRAIDEELTAGERMEVEAHLSECETCRARYRELGALSVRIEELSRTLVVPVDLRAGRERLETELTRREQAAAQAQRSRRMAIGIRWGMAIAACLALGVMLMPRAHHAPQLQTAGPGFQRWGATTFDINGESFIALPYSNADLPVSVSHIVEMQVPVAALTEAGVVFEPVTMQALNQNGSVLADVLLGEDGEPVGVHVIAAEE
jgi:anti-sigma factor RsiW